MHPLHALPPWKQEVAQRNPSRTPLRSTPPHPEKPFASAKRPRFVSPSSSLSASSPDKKNATAHPRHTAAPPPAPVEDPFSDVSLHAVRTSIRALLTQSTSPHNAHQHSNLERVRTLHAQPAALLYVLGILVGLEGKDHELFQPVTSSSTTTSGAAALLSSRRVAASLVRTLLQPWERHAARLQRYYQHYGNASGNGSSNWGEEPRSERKNAFFCGLPEDEAIVPHTESSRQWHLVWRYLFPEEMPPSSFVWLDKVQEGKPPPQRSAPLSSCPHSACFMPENVHVDPASSPKESSTSDFTRQGNVEEENVCGAVYSVPRAWCEAARALRVAVHHPAFGLIWYRLWRFPETVLVPLLSSFPSTPPDAVSALVAQVASVLPTLLWGMAHTRCVAGKIVSSTGCHTASSKDPPTLRTSSHLTPQEKPSANKRQRMNAINEEEPIHYPEWQRCRRDPSLMSDRSAEPVERERTPSDHPDEMERGRQSRWETSWVAVLVSEMTSPITAATPPASNGGSALSDWKGDAMGTQYPCTWESCVTSSSSLEQRQSSSAHSLLSFFYAEFGRRSGSSCKSLLSELCDYVAQCPVPHNTTTTLMSPELKEWWSNGWTIQYLSLVLRLLLETCGPQEGRRIAAPASPHPLDDEAEDSNSSRSSFDATAPILPSHWLWRLLWFPLPFSDTKDEFTQWCRLLGLLEAKLLQYSLSLQRLVPLQHPSHTAVVSPVWGGCTTDGSPSSSSLIGCDSIRAVFRCWEKSYQAMQHVLRQTVRWYASRCSQCSEITFASSEDVTLAPVFWELLLQHIQVEIAQHIPLAESHLVFSDREDESASDGHESPISSPLHLTAAVLQGNLRFLLELNSLRALFSSSTASLHLSTSEILLHSSSSPTHQQLFYNAYAALAHATLPLCSHWWGRAVRPLQRWSPSERDGGSGGCPTLRRSVQLLTVLVEAWCHTSEHQTDLMGEEEEEEPEENSGARLEQWFLFQAEESLRCLAVHLVPLASISVCGEHLIQREEEDHDGEYELPFEVVERRQMMERLMEAMTLFCCRLSVLVPSREEQPSFHPENGVDHWRNTTGVFPPVSSSSRSSPYPLVWWCQAILSPCLRQVTPATITGLVQVWNNARQTGVHPFFGMPREVLKTVGDVEVLLFLFNACFARVAAESPGVWREDSVGEEEPAVLEANVIALALYGQPWGALCSSEDNNKSNDYSLLLRSAVSAVGRLLGSLLYWKEAAHGLPPPPLEKEKRRAVPVGLVRLQLQSLQFLQTVLTLAVRNVTLPARRHSPFAVGFGCSSTTKRRFKFKSEGSSPHGLRTTSSSSCRAARLRLAELLVAASTGGEVLGQPSASSGFHSTSQLVRTHTPVPVATALGGAEGLQPHPKDNETEDDQREQYFLAEAWISLWYGFLHLVEVETDNPDVQLASVESLAQLLHVVLQASCIVEEDGRRAHGGAEGLAVSTSTSLCTLESSYSPTPVKLHDASTPIGEGTTNSLSNPQTTRHFAFQSPKNNGSEVSEAEEQDESDGSDQHPSPFFHMGHYLLQQPLPTIKDEKEERDGVHLRPRCTVTSGLTLPPLAVLLEHLLSRTLKSVSGAEGQPPATAQSISPHLLHRREARLEEQRGQRRREAAAQSRVRLAIYQLLLQVLPATLKGVESHADVFGKTLLLALVQHAQELVQHLRPTTVNSQYHHEIPDVPEESGEDDRLREQHMLNTELYDVCLWDEAARLLQLLSDAVEWVWRSPSHCASNRVECEVVVEEPQCMQAGGQTCLTEGSLDTVLLTALSNLVRQVLWDGVLWHRTHLLRSASHRSTLSQAEGASHKELEEPHTTPWCADLSSLAPSSHCGTSDSRAAMGDTSFDEDDFAESSEEDHRDETLRGRYELWIAALDLWSTATECFLQQHHQDPLLPEEEEEEEEARQGVESIRLNAHSSSTTGWWARQQEVQQLLRLPHHTADRIISAGEKRSSLPADTESAPRKSCSTVSPEDHPPTLPELVLELLDEVRQSGSAEQFRSRRGPSRSVEKGNVEEGDPPVLRSPSSSYCTSLAAMSPSMDSLLHSRFVLQRASFSVLYDAIVLLSPFSTDSDIVPTPQQDSIQRNPALTSSAATALHLLGDRITHGVFHHATHTLSMFMFPFQRRDDDGGERGSTPGDDCEGYGMPIRRSETHDSDPAQEEEQLQSPLHSTVALCVAQCMYHWLRQATDRNGAHSLKMKMFLRGSLFQSTVRKWYLFWLRVLEAPSAMRSTLYLNILNACTAAAAVLACAKEGFSPYALAPDFTVGISSPDALSEHPRPFYPSPRCSAPLTAPEVEEHSLLFSFLYQCVGHLDSFCPALAQMPTFCSSFPSRVLYRPLLATPGLLELYQILCHLGQFLSCRCRDTSVRGGLAPVHTWFREEDFLIPLYRTLVQFLQRSGVARRHLTRLREVWHTFSLALRHADAAVEKGVVGATHLPARLSLSLKKKIAIVLG